MWPKRKQQGARRPRLLCEPPAQEEEQQAGDSVITTGGDSGQQKRERDRRRNELGPLLSLLFGSILLLALSLAANSSNVTSPLNATTTTTTTTLAPTTTSLAPSNAISANESDILAPTVATPSDAAVETTSLSPPSTELEEEEADLEASDSPAQPEGGSGRSLDRRLLVEVGEEATDLLADRKGKAADEPDELVETTTTTGGSEDAAKRRQVGENRTQEEEELAAALETYERWRATSDDLIELFSRKLLPLVVEQGYDVDPVTVTGLLQVFNGIRAIKPWALKLLDASAKLMPGLLMATQSDFGDYDECLNVRADDPSGLATPESLAELDPDTGLPVSALVGRYCLADVEFPKPPRRRLAERNHELQSDYEPIELRRPLYNFSESAAFKDTIFVETANFFHMLYVDPVRVGLCLTNKIDPENFARVVNKLLEPYKVSLHFRARCVTKYDPVRWSLQQRISAWVLVVACSLVLLCTLLDLLHTKLNKLPAPPRLDKPKRRLQRQLERWRPLFTSFSIVRNTKRLFKPHQKQPLPEQRKLEQPHVAGAIDASLISSSSHGLCSASSCDSSEPSPSIGRRSSDVHLIGSHHHPKQLDQLAYFATSDLKEAKKQLPNLLPLHGIRVITMTWMIVNHTYLFGGFFVLWAHRRLIDIAEWPKSLSFQLVLNGWLTVETYFFLSALIIVLNVMPLMRRRKFAYPTYILHRLIRLLPAYVGLVCLNFLWPLISGGPVWLVKGRSFIQTPCENYLWTNFLFVNNWIWPEKQCMVHTWFLSADFQLYLLAPVIVYCLYRRPVFGHSLNIIVALLASLLSGFVIYANKLMPTTLINKLEFDSIKQQLSYSYFATYQHMGPYCLGLFIGYLLHKRPHMRLPRHLTWLLWLLLPPLSFTTLLLTYLWNGAYQEPQLINPSPLVSAVYVAIHRTIWSSLLAWIVFACATGRAKLMAQFLAHPIFIPLSRLSFSIYLVHLPVIMFRALNLRHTIEWSDANILWEACGNLIVSTIVGYFVNVAFESPIINLEQALFGRPSLAGKLDDQRNDDPTINNPDQELAQQKAATRGDRSSLDSSSQSDTSSPANSPRLFASAKVDATANSKANLNQGGQYRKLSDSTTLTPPDTSLDSSQGTSMDRVAPPVAGAKTTMTLDDYVGRRHLQPPNAHRRQRAPQYVTLARTSQFNHDQAARYDDGWSELSAAGRTTTRSQLGGSISARAHQQQHQVALDRHSRSNRPGSYNTLTGAGRSEWLRYRQQAPVMSPAWGRSDFESHQQAYEQQQQQLPIGAMIPRIDSASLRRSNRMRAAPRSELAQASILEEGQLEVERSEM